MATRYVNGKNTMYNIGYWNKKLGSPINDTKLRYYAQSLPILGDLVRFYESEQKTRDYMSNRGLSWDDVRYVTNLPSSTISAPNVTNRLDKNMNAIERLYSDDSANPKPIKYNHHGTAYTSRNFYNDY